MDEKPDPRLSVQMSDDAFRFAHPCADERGARPLDAETLPIASSVAVRPCCALSRRRRYLKSLGNASRTASATVMPHTRRRLYGRDVPPSFDQRGRGVGRVESKRRLPFGLATGAEKAGNRPRGHKQVPIWPDSAVPDGQPSMAPEDMHTVKNPGWLVHGNCCRRGFRKQVLSLIHDKLAQQSPFTSHSHRLLFHL